MELREGDSLEGSAHIPKYNYHILPLTVYTLYNIILFFDGRIEIFSFLTLQFLPIIILPPSPHKYSEAGSEKMLSTSR